MKRERCLQVCVMAFWRMTPVDKCQEIPAFPSAWRRANARWASPLAFSAFEIIDDRGLLASDPRVFPIELSVETAGRLPLVATEVEA